jgi:triacylglycerol lipase
MDRALAARCALLARAAEVMTDFGDTPDLDASVAADWELVGYLTAQNALFGAQHIGLGDRCYFGFVARSKESPWRYAAVIRGTETTIEWLENAEAVFAIGPHGCVAVGFWSIYASLCWASRPAASALTEFSGCKEMIVIGHSLGAALATYLMADLKSNAPPFVVTGALFASPKPGDGNYAHWVDAIVGRDNYAVYNYSRDLVPRLPFSLPFGLGFQPLPNVIWLTPSMAPDVKVGNDLSSAHNALTYAALLQPSSIDHAIAA